jgi:hypothetical protein
MGREKQGGFQDWAELRNHLINRYGSTPHPTTEQEIIDAYELHPDQVTKAALAQIDQPNITSHWGLLKSKASKIAAPPANPTHNTALSREKAIAHAEQWIRAAGLHYDSVDEVRDELFGDRGQLRQWAQVDQADNEDAPGWHYTEPTGDLALITHMLDTWANHRPTGMQIERDALSRAEAWKAWKKLQTTPNIPF